MREPSYFNLLDSAPRSSRNIAARVGDKESNRTLALQFGREYFDGTREQGYGGYQYDGRWQPVARRIVETFALTAHDVVLDVGCAKGFLVKDLRDALPGLGAYGLDVSSYAISHAPSEVRPYLLQGSCDALPFPDASCGAVLAINTIHNLDRAGCVRALREIERVAPGRGFVQVDAYRTEAERQVFEDWMLTAKTYEEPESWLSLFREAGFTGYYCWTILLADGTTA